MRTAQELFDTVVNHLRRQHARSLDKYHVGCAYRGEHGMMCAVGCLIPDAAYNPELEGKVLSSIVSNPRWSQLLPDDLVKEFAAHRILLGELQTIHDTVDPERWEKEFTRLAPLYELTVPVKE